MKTMNDPAGIIKKKFGKLRVIRFLERKGRWLYYECRCKCGNLTRTRAGNLVSGNSQSCGCTRHRKLVERNTIHGKSRTPEYRSWAAAKTRATNPNIANSKDYSDRGIGMCVRFQSSFEEFFADVGPRPKGRAFAIERVNNNQGYDCGKCGDCVRRGVQANCRWATYFEQNSNRRNNRNITIDGVTKTITEWIRTGMINGSVFYYRLANGWDEASAIAKAWISSRKGGSV